MKKIISVLLCAVLLFSLAACGSESASSTPASSQPAATPEPTPEATPDPTGEALAAYDAAIDSLLAADDLALALSVDTVRSVNGQSFAEHSEEELKFQGLQGDSPVIVRLQDLSFFGSEVPYEYVFSAGNVYIDGVYRVAMDAEDYISTLYPLQLFDAENFETVELSGSTLSFTDAVKAEAWLGEGIEFISAEAKAVLDGEAIDSLSYNALYTQNAVELSISVTMDVIGSDVGADLRTSVPGAAGLVELGDIRLVELFDRAYYAPNGSPAQTSLSNTVYTVAAGSAVMTENNTLDVYGSGEDIKMKAEYTQALTEAGQSYNWNTLVSYADGVYTVDADGEVSEESLAADQLAPGAVITEYVLTPDWLADISLRELGGYYYVEFGGGEGLGEALQAGICEYLYGDSTLLDSISSAYATDAIAGWLSIDADSMLPVSYGLEYAGHHSIDGADYTIALNNYVSFDLASDSACETVTGEAQPEAEPENKATPLFYKVSGENGQEMWLLGTIHVGDSRTAYLPESIYTALEGSDALAVEVDVSAVEDQIETDEELLNQYIAAVMYSDGSTVKDHIDATLYEDGMDLMRASGSYVLYTMEYMKPAVLGGMIESAALIHGSTLSTEKGVDMRLLALAEEKGIDIREVESFAQQMNALYGGSEALQEYILRSAVETERTEYADEAYKLYELWCAGDEAALSEAINSEAADITEEEMPLYEEYAKAMYTDRNANMHETAVGYLESGETVFYAVGLAHLLGMDGLVDSLRAAGYTVEIVG